MARNTGNNPTRIASSLALVFFLTTTSQTMAGGELTGVPEVIEGDIIALQGHRIRLLGIDAPEPGQRCLFREKLYDCGEISRSALMDLTAGTEIGCTTLGEGPGGTVEALCRADSYDLSEGMVYTGWALPVDRGEEHYSRQLEQAKSKGHGLWRGSFVAPWEWAQGRRLPEEKGG